MAGRARGVGAGQEQQLDRDEALPLAGLAPPSATLKENRPAVYPRACASSVAANSLRTASNIPVYVARLDRGVRPIGAGRPAPAGRSASNPDAVVDVDLELGLVGVLALAEVGAHDLGEHLRDQGRLPGAGHPGHRRQHAERHVDGHVTQVVR